MHMLSYAVISSDDQPEQLNICCHMLSFAQTISLSNRVYVVIRCHDQLKQLSLYCHMLSFVVIHSDD